MNDEISPELWKRISWAISAASVNRHEWNLLQADCHKRNCACQAHQNGDPEEALALVQEAVRESIYDELRFQMVTEPNVESYRLSPVVIQQIKKQLEDIK
ncbi:hypothetical protein BJF89_13755 [Corynebacterium sp. CNJ-954]|uniref:hypothetical protein n=1 Tax=Corynebacterium sp. CNJ-954 TaxID=1904962 RepID=UPI0009657250|nr:hypothetical protein [Corynebacterium sp. CNJ-954]OLT55847.1 hypothetical protein BJF89_13755 [Corynebacterium sp. CNJ-954]